MSISLNYVVNMQRVDADNTIRNQMDASASLVLPNNILGDDTIALANGAVNTPVTLLNTVVDFLFIQSDKDITIRLIANDAPALTTKAFFLDGKNITAVFLSNASGSTATVRIVQALTQALS